MTLTTQSGLTLPALYPTLPDTDALAALVASYDHNLTLVSSGPIAGHPGQYEATYSYAGGRFHSTFGYYRGEWSLWAD